MLIAVDKPKGMSSFDIIRALKRELGEKKIGHSGTLDPMATGLLLIGTAKDTKQLQHLTGLDKEYLTTIDFSKTSDTRDLDYRETYEEFKVCLSSSNEVKDIANFTEEQLGIIYNNNFTPAPTIQQIKAKLDSIIPEGDLPLTPFSAKKKDGKKLYELARKGEKIIENKIMKINGYKIIDYNFPNLELKLNVGSGTYIRSIGYWLGRELGVGGLLTSLRRTSIQDYKIKDMNLNNTGTFFIKSRGENGEEKGQDKGEIIFNYGEI